ncbi:MAG: hypothetical protein H0V98_07330 [Chloroflexia bacterium]|nr:hypothetical protein [Chloroflexia bacterium]
MFDRSRGDPTPESFFGASGDDLMDALPLTPLETPDVPPLEPADCAAEPRTSGEALDILATPPAHGAAEPGSDASIEGVTNDELNSALRGWQACLVFGDTFGAMAYESEQYLREHLYPTSHMSELPAGVTPDVFLSNRISADTIRAALFQANPEPASYIVDTSVPPTSSQTWDWVEVNIVLVWPETNRASKSVDRGHVHHGRWGFAYPEHRRQYLQCKLRKHREIGPADPMLPGVTARRCGLTSLEN